MDVAAGLRPIRRWPFGTGSNVLVDAEQPVEFPARFVGNLFFDRPIGVQGLPRPDADPVRKAPDGGFFVRRAARFDAPRLDPSARIRRSRPLRRAALRVLASGFLAPFGQDAVGAPTDETRARKGGSRWFAYFHGKRRIRK